MQLSDYSYATADSLYHVKAKELNFVGSTGTLDIKKLALSATLCVKWNFPGHWAIRRTVLILNLTM